MKQKPISQNFKFTRITWLRYTWEVEYEVEYDGECLGTIRHYHNNLRDWSAKAPDGQEFRATARREILIELRAHALQTRSQRARTHLETMTNAEEFKEILMAVQDELAEASHHETLGDYSKAMGIYVALGMFSSKYRDDIRRCQRKLVAQLKGDA